MNDWSGPGPAPVAGQFDRQVFPREGLCHEASRTSRLDPLPKFAYTGLV